jgi:hypothetical protein
MTAAQRLAHRGRRRSIMQGFFDADGDDDVEMDELLPGTPRPAALGRCALLGPRGFLIVFRRIVALLYYRSCTLYHI